VLGKLDGSPPRAWGQLSSPYGIEDSITVHPHGRGDNAILKTVQGKSHRFTPTGVGTMLTKRC